MAERFVIIDPDTCVMRKSKTGAYAQSINPQASVDADGSYLIVRKHISQCSSDSNELLPAYEAIEHLTKETNCEIYLTVHLEDAYNERSYDYRTEISKVKKNLSNETHLKMRDKLSSEDGKLIYKLQSQTIETIFGIIKEDIGFRGFRLRVFKKMAGEWELSV